VFPFAESVRNRRIALLPSALWLCRCRLGSSIYFGCCHLLARTRRLLITTSGSAAHVRSHPNSAILQSEINAKLQAAVTSASLLRNGS
jgi:hypothetical protein